MSNAGEKRIAQHEQLPSAPISGGQPPPKSIPGILWRRRWSVTLVAALCVAGAVGYLLKATPLYPGVSQLYIEPSGPKILGSESPAQSRNEGYLYAQAQVITSTPVLAAAIERSGAAKMRSFEGIDNLIAYLKKEMTVEVGKKDQIVTVSFEAAYPQEAARITNAVVSAYMDYQAGQKRTTASEVLRILQKEQQKREQERSDLQERILKFRQANPQLVGDYERGNIVTGRLMKLYDALVDAQLQTLDAKSNYEASKSLVKDPQQLRALLEAQRVAKGTWWGQTGAGELRMTLGKLELELLLARQ